MASGCRQENCTVGETGVCLLNNDPTSCSNRIAEHQDGLADVTSPPLDEPASNEQFPRGLTLSRGQARELMAGRYCRIVGILGAPDAGKTAALVSLYLLLARNHLAGFGFADSRTLMTFDEISQGARRWNEGNLPDQLTAHTELSDERTAGFLHLRLSRSDGSDRVDLLLPDLPGEWSTDLIDKNRFDRLTFLQSADVIWLMVDGCQFLNRGTRRHALHRTILLMQRLRSVVNPTPPVILVVTRGDKGELENGALSELIDEAAANGFSFSVKSIASFAEAGGVMPGHGIAELIEATVSTANITANLWPSIGKPGSEPRAMLRFRLDGVDL